ncbi:MAG: M48 family metallopeptidase [Saprospiraceae bacterium]
MNVLIKHKTIVYHITVLVLLIFSSGILVAQYESNYETIKAEGRIPNDFLNLVRGQSRINLNNTERLTKAQRENFRDATNLALRNIFTDGNIYFNDRMTEYVRAVGKRLVKGTESEGRVQFFVHKSQELNAASWQTGTIVINIGLLSRLQNEAQLAYVLSHEIAHFQKQHPYQQYAQQIRQNHPTKSSELVKNFKEHSDYSLKYELEADSIALGIMKKSGYAIDESVYTLEILLHQLPRPFVNLIEYFSSQELQLSRDDICDFKEYSAFKKNGYQLTEQHFSNHHIKRRLANLGRVLENKYSMAMVLEGQHRGVEGQVRFHFDRSILKNVTQTAQFEVINQAFLDANYLKSINEALAMLRSFPNNQFLHSKIAENLYYVQHYSQLDLLDRIFFDNQQIEEDAYARLCCLVNNSSKDSLQLMINGFIKKLYQDYPNNETMLITMAKLTENNEGIKAAKVYYQKYVKLFPFGQHYPDAKRKLR